MTGTSQKDRILEHLTELGPITPLEALGEYGVYRLSAVILDLRREGYDIHTELQPNARGGRGYAKYQLVKKKKREIDIND